MIAGAYVSNFSSGGRIHEDNGGLPLPDAYQVSPTMLYAYAVLLLRTADHYLGTTPR